METMTIKRLTTIFLPLMLASSIAYARQPIEHSCAFIVKNALNNAAECFFTDKLHSSVLISATRNISTKQAGEWIISAASFLQVGGEHNFDSITVIPSPSSFSITVEAKSTDRINIKDDPEKARKLIEVCKHASDWSEVVGPDGAPAAKPKCKPLR
jgi:hypothetical protein